MALPGNKNFSDYDNYITDQNPTTSAQAQDYFRNQAELLKAVIDCDFWQPETVYQPGDVVKSDSMPNGTEAVMVATKASVTSNVEPQWGAVGGANVSDGACFWKLRRKAVTVNSIEADNEGNIQIPVMQGSTSTNNGIEGLVPAPSAGGSNRYLNADGTFKEVNVPVTSVNGKTGDVIVDVGVISVNNKTGDVSIKESPDDMIDYIVETYRNGTEWYDVYKSGKVVQGGKTPAKEASSGQIITLLKAYANTDFNVMVTCLSKSATDRGFNYGSPDSTTTIRVVTTGSGAYWFTCGQGA